MEHHCLLSPLPGEPGRSRLWALEPSSRAVPLSPGPLDLAAAGRCAEPQLFPWHCLRTVCTRTPEPTPAPANPPGHPRHSVPGPPNLCTHQLQPRRWGGSSEEETRTVWPVPTAAVLAQHTHPHPGHRGAWDCLAQASPSHPTKD